MIGLYCHRHPIERGAEISVASLCHPPARLLALAMAGRALLLGMSAGKGGQLVKVVEAPDVSDLGDQAGGNRGPDTGDGLQATRELGIEELGDSRLGRLDLLSEEVVLPNEQPDLECHLLVQLRWRNGLLDQLLDTAGPTATHCPATAGRHLPCQRAQP